MSTMVSDGRPFLYGTTLHEKLHGALAATPWWLISLVFHFAILTFAYFYTWEVPLPKEEVVLKPEIVSKVELPPVMIETPRWTTEDPKVVKRPTKVTEVRKVSISQQKLPQLSDILDKPKGSPRKGLAVLAAPGGVMQVGQIGDGEGLRIAPDGLDEALGDMGSTGIFKNRCLLIWLFDESKSMKPHQQLIRRKVDELYENLGITQRDSVSTRHILTTVCSYGKDFHVELKDPTMDAQKIREAINKVPVDAFGIENYLTAINMALSEYSTYAQKYSRNIVIIVVTDEAGDDDTKWEDGGNSLLEVTVARMKKAKATLLVFGQEAGGFGYAAEQTYDPTVPKGYSPYSTVNRGIESAFSEMFPHNWGLFYSFRATQRVPSGFGPYGASRVCRETGGVYYLLRASDVKSYDYEKLLGGYQPELASRLEIAKRNHDNRLRRAIMGIIDLFKTTWDDDDKRFGTGFSNDEAGRRAVERCIQIADDWLKLVNEVIERMGTLANVTAEDSTKRWEADRDLVFAHLHKIRFQIVQYKMALLDLQQGRKVPPPGDVGWMVYYSGPLRFDEQNRIAEEQKKVQALYQLVIDKHLGTPWEVFARNEMRNLHGYAITAYSRSRSSGGESPKIEPR